MTKGESNVIIIVLIIALASIFVIYYTLQKITSPSGTAIPNGTVLYSEVNTRLYSGSCTTDNSGKCYVSWTQQDNFNSSLNYSIIMYQPYNITYYKYIYTYVVTDNGKLLTSGVLGSDSPTITLDDIFCEARSPLVISCPIPPDTTLKLENVTRQLNTESGPFYSALIDGIVNLSISDGSGNTMFSDTCNFYEMRTWEPYNRICFFEIDQSTVEKLKGFKTVTSVLNPEQTPVKKAHISLVIDGKGYFAKCIIINGQCVSI